MGSSLLHDIHPFVTQYGYAGITLIILLENAGLPLPGEVALILGGIEASQGALDIKLDLFLCWTGAVCGNHLGYWIGRTGGHRLLVRYGGRIGITQQRLKSAEGFFDRRGDVVLVFGRFVLGLRQFSGIVAGTLEMNQLRFVVYNMVGAAAWVGFWGILAYLLGKRINVFLDFVGNFLPLVLIAVVLFAVGVTVYIFRHNAKS